MADPVMMNTGPMKMLGKVEGPDFLRIERAARALPGMTDLSDAKILMSNAHENSHVHFVFEARKSANRVDLRPTGDILLVLTPTERDMLQQRLEKAPGTSVSGKDFTNLSIAVREFRKRQLDVSLYRIELVQEGDLITAIFSDRQAVPGTLGIRTRVPGFEVAMEAPSGKVLSANFTR